MIGSKEEVEALNMPTRQLKLLEKPAWALPGPIFWWELLTSELPDRFANLI